MWSEWNALIRYQRVRKCWIWKLNSLNDFNCCVFELIVISISLKKTKLLFLRKLWIPQKNLFQKHCKLFISLKFKIKETKYSVKPLDPSRTNTSFLSDQARLNIERPHYFLKNIPNPPRSLQHFVWKLGDVRTALLDPRATLFWCMNLRRIWERIVTFSPQRFSDFWCKSAVRTPPFLVSKSDILE